MSSRVILSVKYTVAGQTAARAVAGFLRYVQYRDHHELAARGDGVEGLTRYVAYRDKASPQGRLFDAEGTIGDPERRALAAYVRRSTKAARTSRGMAARAVYRLVISPEDARGLDLRAVTRAAMDRLAEDAGGLPPWIASEHRNTPHPHVHVVLAGFREVEPGCFRQVVITKRRLATMKTALGLEMARQRGERPLEPKRRQRPVHDRAERRSRRRNRPPRRTIRYRRSNLLSGLLLASRIAQLEMLELAREREREDRERARGRER